MKTHKNIYKGIVTICLVWLLLGCNSGSPKSGEWSGNGITFTVADNKATISELEVMIPLGNEQYYSQIFNNLEISNNKFNYSNNGNSAQGIPEIELNGEFVANNLAKGVFNDFDWTATPR